MDLTGYANRDAKLIRENEGKTPTELAGLGLSPKAYERLTAQLEAERTAPTQGQKIAAREIKVTPQPKVTTNGNGPIQPTKTETGSIQAKAHQPMLSAPPISSGAQMKQLTIVGPTGIPQTMNAQHAEKLVRSNPGLYQIID